MATLMELTATRDELRKKKAWLNWKLIYAGMGNARHDDLMRQDDPISREYQQLYIAERDVEDLIRQAKQDLG